MKTKLLMAALLWLGLGACAEAAVKVTDFSIPSNYGGDGADRSLSTFNAPDGLARDASGNLYAADSANCVIRVISSTGAVSTLAGSFVGNPFNPSDNCNAATDGIGTAARFRGPKALALDSLRGLLYVLDSDSSGGTSYVRRIDLSSARVETVAGGTFGTADGVGSAAGFSQPRGAALDPTGSHLYVAENARVRNVVLASSNALTLAVTDVNGTAENNGVALSADGATLYVTQGGSGDDPCRVLRVTVASSQTETMAGQFSCGGDTDAAGASARFTIPYGIVVDSAGLNLYITESAPSFGNGGYALRRIVIASSDVVTLAGLAGTSGDAVGSGNSARFNKPQGIAIDTATGSLFFADTGNNKIKRFHMDASSVSAYAGLGAQADGTVPAVTFQAGSLSSNPNFAFAKDSSSNVYVADASAYVIRMISSTGAVTTLAGSPGAWGFADGTGSAARFNGPSGIAVDRAGTTLYIADRSNERIRKLDVATGQVTTLAGNGTSASVDGIGASAQFRRPRTLVLSPEGADLWVGEEYALRKVVLASSQVVTAAGDGSTAGSADGIGTNARFNLINGIASDSSGAVLYIADGSAFGIAPGVRRFVTTSSSVVTMIPGYSGAGIVMDPTGTYLYLGSLNIWRIPLGAYLKNISVGLPRSGDTLYELGPDTAPAFGLLARGGPSPYGGVRRVSGLDLANNAPNAPKGIQFHVYPSTLTVSTITVKWHNADPDCDPVHFQVEFSTRDDFAVKTAYDSSVSSQGFKGYPSAMPSGADNSLGCNSDEDNFHQDGTFTNSISSPLPSGRVWWRVRAWDGLAYSGYSSTASIYVLTAPAAPAGFAGAAQSTGSILWTWTDASDNEDGFKVFSSTGAQALAALAAGTTYWGQGGLTPNTSYQNYVQAFNTVGTSSSGAAARYTLAAPASGTALSSVFYSSITVNWSRNGDPDATVFYLDRSTDNVSYGQISSGTFLTLTDTSLFEDTSYYYKVRAANGDGALSDYDGPVSTRTLKSGDTTPPTAITTLSGQSWLMSGTILLSWTSPYDAGNSTFSGQYAIQYSTFDTTFATYSAQVFFSTANAVPGAHQSCTLSDLVLGATYFIRVFSSDLAQNWSPVSNGATVQAGLGGMLPIGVPGINRPYGRSSPMARDSSGTLYSAYVKYYAAAASTQVFVARSTDSGVSWSDMGDAPIATVSGYPQANPVLAMDSLNVLHAAWEGRDSSYPNDPQIKHSYYNGAAWSAARNVTTQSGRPQSAPSIAVDASNVLHALWRGNDNLNPVHPQLRYARYASGAWSSPSTVQTVANYSQGDPVLALDPSGGLHAVWYGGDSTYGNKTQIKYSKFNGASWSSWVNIAPVAGQFQCLPVIAVDTDSNIHVLWDGADASNPTPFWQIKHSSYTASSSVWSSWSNIQTIAGYPQLFPSVAVDSSGSLVALWQGSDPASPAYTQIKLSKRTGGVWSGWINKVVHPSAHQQWPALRWSQFSMNGGPLSWLWRDLSGPTVRSDPDPETAMGAGAPTVRRSAVTGGPGGDLLAVQPAGLWSVKVVVPPGSLPAGTTVLVDAAASLPDVPAFGFKSLGGLEVSAGGLQPVLPLTIELSYGERLVSALNGSQPEAEALRIARFEPSGWVFLPTTPAPGRRSVSAQTGHLSLFALFAKAQAASLDQVLAYPVPWKPGSGGRFDSPAGRSGPVFANLPAEATISIYAIDGARVRRLAHSGGATEVWDGNNSDGRPAASGVYVAVIESGGDRVRRRVVVIR